MPARKVVYWDELWGINSWDDGTNVVDVVDVEAGWII